MFQPSHQLQVKVPPLAVQESLSLTPMDVSKPGSTPVAEIQNGEDLVKVGSIVDNTKKLQDELEKLGCKIKDHEDNIKFLKTLKDNLHESILDMQVNLGKYHSASVGTAANENSSHIQAEDGTVEQILKQEKSAAGILCQLKTRHETQASHLPFMKDVLGIVATLGKVDNENLSRLLSEYLGLETMTAIVCKTFEGVKALETYDKEGNISKSTGLHGLGPPLGRHLEGRFLVICLEGLRPYVGELVIDDPQQKLALIKPRLPSGECPPGFLGFAVNMIDLDFSYLSYRTASGHGLRPTLFYSLFSRVQVYRTRGEMLLALPCISDGALSLDGGMIKSGGTFSLGDRKVVEVRFAVRSRTSYMSSNDYREAEEKLKFTKWEQERIVHEMQREEILLNNVKFQFQAKRKEFVKFLAESSSFVTQQQAQHAGSRSSTPR